MIDTNLKDFKGRAEKLEAIKRYNVPRHQPMHYRTNVLGHSQRVYFMLKDIMPRAEAFYGSELNKEKALCLTLIHDDPEIYIGDIQMDDKEKMSKDELDNKDKREIVAIERLADESPKFLNEFNYRDLLYTIHRKDILEAQLVSFIDKTDGFCEALHEIHAGNILFIKPAVNYVRRLNNYPKKFPILNDFLSPELDHPLLCLPEEYNPEPIVADGRLHTAESVRKPTNFPQYDRWRKITAENFGIEALIAVKEK